MPRILVLYSQTISINACNTKFEGECMITIVLKSDELHVKYMPTFVRLSKLCKSCLSTSSGNDSSITPSHWRDFSAFSKKDLKTRAFIDNPAHHALHEFDGTTRELYVPKPNRRGGMTRPPAYPIGLKVEAAMASVEIKVESVCPLITPSFPPGTHFHDPKRHNLIEGVSKCMITRQEAQA